MLAAAIGGGLRTAVAHTVHGPLGGMAGEMYEQIARIAPNVGLISISMNQRKPDPDLNWIGNCPNALDFDLYPFGPASKKDGGEYLLFLGRMTADKGAHRAVRTAIETGLPLKLAGKKREPLEQQYFDAYVRPHLNDRIEYLGEVSHGEKVELLQHARATLFPINWEEPFGLVMIESMACGTPVVATRRGAVPEVIERGTWRRDRRRLARRAEGARGGGWDSAGDVPRVRRGALQPRADAARLPPGVPDVARAHLTGGRSRRFRRASPSTGAGRATTARTGRRGRTGRRRHPRRLSPPPRSPLVEAVPHARGPAVQLDPEPLQVIVDVGLDAEVDQREPRRAATRDLGDRRVPRLDVDVGRRRDREDVARRLDAHARRVARVQRPVAVEVGRRGGRRGPASGTPPARATSPSAARTFASGTGASSPQSVSKASP